MNNYNHVYYGHRIKVKVTGAKTACHCILFATGLHSSEKHSCYGFVNQLTLPWTLALVHCDMTLLPPWHLYCWVKCWVIVGKLWVSINSRSTVSLRGYNLARWTARGRAIIREMCYTIISLFFQPIRRTFRVSIPLPDCIHNRHTIRPLATVLMLLQLGRPDYF